MENQVNERPILFSAAMVRAILDGRKTQTRRIVKGAEGKTWHAGACGILDPGPVHWNIGGTAFRCPYGQPGDRLWVKETWRTLKAWDHVAPSSLPAYDDPVLLYEADGAIQNPNDRLGLWGKTRVSIHMPRWASRLTLEVTGIRIERLQNISEADAWAEGIGTPGRPLQSLFNILIQFPNLNLGELALSMPEDFAFGDDPKVPTDRERVTWVTARGVYAALWNAINGPGSWEENPWVWVVEFRKVKP